MATWFDWEIHLRNWMERQDILPILQTHQTLSGYQDEKGRITYARIANPDSFGIFSSIVTNMVPREEIARKLSIATVFRRNFAKQGVAVYPRYLVQFADLDMSDSASFPTASDSERATFEDVLYELDSMEEKKPLVGICILENVAANMFHGTAFIAWKDNSRYHYAYYDPLAYRRYKKRADGTTAVMSYDYAATVFQSHRFAEWPIEFYDLSEYCVRRDRSKEKEAEYHCPQYVMDAEYCYLYSLYFLCQWVHIGASMTKQGFAEAVRRSYIVDDPQKVTRLNTHDSMIYRVIMMSFIMTVLWRYLALRPKENTNELSQLRSFQDRWYERYGFPLMVPVTAKQSKW